MNAPELVRRFWSARLVTSGHGVPGLKAAMHLAGYRGGEPRPPLAPAGPGPTGDIAFALETLRATYQAEFREAHIRPAAAERVLTGNGPDPSPAWSRVPSTTGSR